MDTFVIRDEATPRHALARLPTAEAGKDAHAGEMNVIVWNVTLAHAYVPF